MDLVFAPTVDEVYPPGVRHERVAWARSRAAGGRGRPGHFDGVATVVAILFALVGAERAYFGLKDYQQVQVIRADGARPRPARPRWSRARRSARRTGWRCRRATRRLSPAGRAAAPVLRRALVAGAAAVRSRDARCGGRSGPDDGRAPDGAAGRDGLRVGGGSRTRSGAGRRRGPGAAVAGRGDRRGPADRQRAGGVPADWAAGPARRLPESAPAQCVPAGFPSVEPGLAGNLEEPVHEQVLPHQLLDQLDLARVGGVRLDQEVRAPRRPRCRCPRRRCAANMPALRIADRTSAPGS